MNKKRCPRCNEYKNLTDFVKRGDKPASICKSCKRKESAKWYAKNKQRQVANARRNAARYRAQFEKWKSSLSCQICNENFDKCLDFHHITNDKEFDISNYRNQGGRRLTEELRKCVVLCSNCHRKVHYGAIDLPTGIVTCNFTPEARRD